LYRIPAQLCLCIPRPCYPRRPFAWPCRPRRSPAVERPQTEDLALDSDIRLGRAQRMLAERPLSPEALMAITRDRSDGEYSICAVSEPPWYSATCGAAIMRPATCEFWGMWGLPHENPYERFTL
jgi:hypothetical protein